MRVKLSKHGNSLGFVVPASIVREAALEIGREYELKTTPDGGLQPTTQLVWRPDLTIEEMLAGLPEQSLTYEDVSEYIPVGRELDW